MRHLSLLALKNIKNAIRGIPMKKKYQKIVKHIKALEDHGYLYMYYGTPASEEYTVYESELDGKNLVLSSECDDLFYAIGDAFEDEMYGGTRWLDIIEQKGYHLTTIFDVPVEKEDLEMISALLYYLVLSITYEDVMIDALQNGFVLRLLKRLNDLTK